MPKSDNNLKSVLQDTANAIRGKTGSSAPITPRDFADEIENIPTGGGDDVALIEGTISGAYNNNQVVTLRSGAFGYCPQLTEVNLPSVSYVGKEAFTYCSGLLKANIPIATVVESFAFFSCVNLSSINASGIISIRTSAFAYCSKLKEAVFPQCTSLGSHAFLGCTSLERISFDALSDTLSYFAVNNNSYLSEINFPNITTFISDIRFSNCSNLRIINLPKLRHITNCSGAFQNCTSLSEVIFPELSDVTISPSLFANTGVERAIMSEFRYFDSGEGMSGFFQNCSKLSYVKMDKIVMLNKEMFSGCTSLTTLSRENFPRLKYIGRIAFSNCTNLSVFDVPTISGIGSYAFTSCISLQKISMQCLMFYSYDYEPFRGCYSLSEISFIHTLGGAQFQNLSNLQRFWTATGNFSAYVFSSCHSLSAVYVFDYSNSVPAMANINAFSNTPISNSSYLGDYGSIYVPASLVESYKSATNWVTYSDRITALPSEIANSYAGKFEFYGRTDLVEIPSDKENVEAICNKAFAGCTSLSSVALQNCKMVAGLAFSGCTNLSLVSLPNCYHIGQQAFFNCSNLTQLYLSECLTISASAFIGAFVLSQSTNAVINIPKCVQIWNSAFSGCQVKDIFAPNLQAGNGSMFYYFSCQRAIFRDLASITSANFSEFRFNSLYLLSRKYVTSINGSRAFGYYYYTITGSIYVPSALLPEYRKFSYYSSRFVGLTDEQIASIYAEFGYSEADL